MTNFEAARWLHPVGGDDAQRPRLDVLLAPAEHARQVVDDVRSGLGRARAQLPLEDLADSRTQALWAQLAGTEHFHPLRATRSLVATNAAAIAEGAGARSLVVIGDADAQVVADLATACATTGLTEVVSVGPVGPRLAAACTSIAELLPGRTVRGVVADPTRQLPLVPFTRPGLLYVQGTTLARLDGTTRSRLLAGAARAMTGDDHLLVGFDLTTDRSQALSAFDDAEGLHAERARNALGVLTREVAAEVDPPGWEPTIGWDDRQPEI